MATIIPATTFPQHGVAQTIWSGFAASADVGRAETLMRYPVKSVQFTGTFAGTPTIILEGSEDGVNFFGMISEGVVPTPTSDIAITTGAAQRFDVIGNPQFIRPRMTAGTGGAAITVTLTSKTFGN